MKKIFKVLIAFTIAIVIIGAYIKFDENLTYYSIMSEYEKLILPTMVPDDLKVEILAEDFSQPTTMSFVGNDILVLEKGGNVTLIRDEVVSSEPILSLNVNSVGERGLLGITTVESEVYLYFSSEETKDEIKNYIYKYQWNGSSLINPQLITILPGERIDHNGGAMTTDVNGNVYAVIGDQTKRFSPVAHYGVLQNNLNGSANDRGIIIKVGVDDSIKPSESPNPFDHYYAIGIRNSFGLAIDPITGNMWATENGEDAFDEINLVSPKFNSGWVMSMGPATEEQKSKMLFKETFKYGDPKFSWEQTVAPTGIIFVTSENFEKYHNTVLVGDCHLGNLYKFVLNENRTDFIFKDPNLSDLVANFDSGSTNPKNLESMDEIIFGKDFGCISDLEFGPDGNLYVVSVTKGKIFKISPK